jgi:drug/metabolite transporter (DMT)-like permease
MPTLSAPVRDRPVLPHLALLGVQALFGSLPVIGKIVLAVIPNLALVGFRVGITAAILYAAQRSRGTLRLTRSRDYWHLAGLSLIGVVLNQIFYIDGLSRTRASNAALLAVTIPVFAMLAGTIAGTERLRAGGLIGIAAAIGGVLLFIDPMSASFSAETTAGDALIILNSAAYGAYVALSKNVIVRNGALRSMTWLFLFASLACVPFGAVSLFSIDVLSVSRDIWIMVLFIAAAATTAPYLLNAWALARVEPSTVAVYIYLQPLIGFVLAAAFLGETIGLKFIISAALVFFGVFLVSRKPHSAVTKQF